MRRVQEDHWPTGPRTSPPARLLAFTAIAVSAVAALAGCSDPDIPEGRFACVVDDDCPPGFGCGADDRCYRPTDDGAVVTGCSASEYPVSPPAAAADEVCAPLTA